MTGNLFENAPGEGSADWFTAWCDGGSRGNPGPAGYGAVVQDPQGGTAAQLSRFLGVHTNNYAEYQGLLAVLEWAVGHGVRRLRVISDSELMVKQMKGQYKVASPGLRPLFEEAKRRVAQLERFELKHTLRGGNAEADRLANDAMDRGTGKTAIPPSGGAVSQRTGDPAGRNPGASAAQTGADPEQKKTLRQVLDGYVKNGVVHLLEGSLPEGSFVKIIRE
jgi:ribonuclease HI